MFVSQEDKILPLAKSSSWRTVLAPSSGLSAQEERPGLTSLHSSPTSSTGHNRVLVSSVLCPLSIGGEAWLDLPPQLTNKIYTVHNRVLVSSVLWPLSIGGEARLDLPPQFTNQLYSAQQGFSQLCPLSSQYRKRGQA